jgi:hypothetical protein
MRSRSSTQRGRPRRGSMYRSACAVLIAGLLAGCAAPPRLTQETSFDGLARVENSIYDQAWVRPGVDLQAYTKLMLQEAGISYRATRAAHTVAATGGREFPLSDRQKERLREIVRTAFAEELAKSQRFEIAREPGPDVLLLRGSLLDVVSFVPPEEAGAGKVYLRAVGEATLVLELRDSTTDAILARIIDRRAAERLGGPLVESNPITNAFEVESAARRWARRFRERLDAVSALERGGDS